MSDIKSLEVPDLNATKQQHTIQDVSGQNGVHAYPTKHANFSISGSISRIINLPISIAKNVFRFQFNTLLKQPFSIISELLNGLVELIMSILSINVEVISEILGLVKQFIAQIIGILVDVGVLQGKTTEEVINSVKNIVLNVIKLALEIEMKISSSIVGFIETFIDHLNIKDIINRIINLPVVKQIARLLNNIRNFINDNFQAQINDIKLLIRGQFQKHKDFFQPIFDGISSRILIITNALHALVNGDLNACPGETNPNKSPSGSLQWQLNIWIDQIKINIFSILGFTGLANKYQDKVNGLKAGGSSIILGPTILPPILSSVKGGF